MRRLILATILIILVFAMAITMPGHALADTYTYTGLGGGGMPLSLTTNATSVFAGMANGHVWRNDGGTTWTDIGSPDPQSSAVNALCWASYERTNHTYLTTVYAGTASGQVYVYDGGVWGWAGFAGYGYSVTSLVDTGGTTWNVYAGSTSGYVYRCHGGTVWDEAKDTTSGVISLAYGGGNVKAGCANGHVWNGFGTGSGNWTDLGSVGSTNAHVVYNDSIGILASCDNVHVYHLISANNWESFGVPSGWDLPALCSVGTSLYAGDGYGTVWSYGGGTTWNNTGLPNSAVNGVKALATDGSNLFASCANGYIARDSSGTWTNTWPTYGSRVYSLLSHGDVYAGCSNGQVYDYNGSNWAVFGNAMPSTIYSLAADSTLMYAGCDDGYVYSHGFGPGNWTSTAGPGTVARSLASDGTVLYAGCVDGHIRYYQSGSWFDGADLGTGWVNALTWSGTNLYAGTQNGYVYRNVGGTWSAGTLLDGSAVNALAWDGSAVYAGTAGGHVYSYSGGVWTDTFPLGSWSINCLASSGGAVYAGNNFGQVLRYMGETTWSVGGTVGVGNSPVKALAWTGTYMYTGGDAGSYRGALTVPPAVTSDPATSITLNGATIKGNITDTGGENADRRGFRYRKVGASSWTNWTEAGSFGTGTFDHPVTGLDPATDYEFQAMAHNWTGQTYGTTVGFATAAIPKPAVDSVSPSYGPPGTRVTIAGGNFGATQGSSTVTVGGVPALVVSWSNTKIVIVIPDGTQGGAVVVTTAAGGSNTDKDFKVPLASTWYLAEGTNAWGFNTYVTIENPNSAALHAKLTYMNPNPAASGGGIAGTRTVVLPPLSQTTVSSASDIGQVDFSTKVQCLEGKSIAVDRTMYWTGPGYSPAQSGYHSSIGTTAPAKTWYLPEGSSDWGFETWTLVQNPNAGSASVTLTYMTEAGPTAVNKTIPANSRATYNMASDIGSHDASIKVTSDVPVVAERSMYRNGKREGSCSIGATTPSADYYLAEGATGYGVGFSTYVLVQNPNDTATNVSLTYQTGTGTVPGPAFTMQPNSRKTVKVNDSLPANTSVSTLVHGAKPIVAERAMYWDNGTGQAFHASIGLSDPHMTFMLPDGQTSGGFETWTLVQNPNPGAVTVRITYLPQGGGKTVTFTSEIPAGTRNTYNMADKLPSGRASILVQSLDGARPVMVERAMYMNSRGAGTDTIGGFSD